MVLIDFETRSRVDIKEVGLYNYVNHPSTEVLLIGYQTPNGSRGTVRQFEDLPASVDVAVLEGRHFFGAFNAAFERAIWERFAPEHLQIPLSRWFCVAAKARECGLPSTLQDVAFHLFPASHSLQKDKRGSFLIKQLCTPQKNGQFLEDAELFKELRDYCVRDVVVTSAILEALPATNGTLEDQWRVNEEVNDNGIRLDVSAAQSMLMVSDSIKLKLGGRLRVLTGGVITSITQTVRAAQFVEKLLTDNAKGRRAITVTNSAGNKKISFAAPVRAELLKINTLPPLVHTLCHIFDEGSNSSVAKFKRMLAVASDDGRIRGSFVHAGASQTLRYSSRGAQLHNFYRDCFTATEKRDFVRVVKAGYVPPMRDISKMLRPSLIPDKGNTFVVGDWSSIEMVALAWLSKHPHAVERLNDYREGVDQYDKTSRQLGLNDRQMGKVTELSMGFSGGEGALDSMATNFGISIPLYEREAIVQKWREANPWAVSFWNGLEHAALSALRNPSQLFTAGRVGYTFQPKLMGGSLVAHLPCGTDLYYPHARLVGGQITCWKSSVRPKANARHWPASTLWRGILVENVTQAACASVQRQTIARAVNEHGMSVVAHVHDEIVLEVPVADGLAAAQTLKRIMTAGDIKGYESLPLRTQPTIMDCYGKD